MTNKAISKLLRDVAASYTIKDESKYRFQALAYLKAADTIEGATSEVENLAKEGKLASLPGVGPSLQKHLGELVETGSVQHFTEVMKDIPQTMFPLLPRSPPAPKKLINSSRTSH